MLKMLYSPDLTDPSKVVEVTVHELTTTRARIERQLPDDKTMLEVVHSSLVFPVAYKEELLAALATRYLLKLDYDASINLVFALQDKIEADQAL